MKPAGGDRTLIQKINTVAVLRALHGAEQLTLRDLAAEAGVSRNTAEDAAVALVSAGLAEEVVPEVEDQRRVGRPAKRYRFRGDSGYVVGVDLAVHEVSMLLVDLRGAERTRLSRHLDPHAPAEDRIAAAREALLAMLRTAGVRRRDVMAVGAATTGIVDHAGRVVRSTRLPQIEGRALAEDLAAIPGVPVVVGNDTRLATLAEHWLGTARGTDNFVNIVAGRHITAGVFLDGRLLRGVHGAAGEIGTLAESRWQDALRAMAAWPDDREATVTAALGGDAAAQARIDELAEHLATGIAAVVLSVDPECVILSGGLSRAGRTLIDPLQSRLDAKTLFSIPIRPSTLDHDAVALGAVRLALDHVENDLFDTESARLAAVL
ncbi:ROK family transcriptional regulator [Streptomyces sp. NRRL WC-3742]|uniref:ROK family transcriptional regulator n=1 Tax=Streptomyces sp. NRRL WC-3742 TaxID=1463934 RepID=UPI0004C524FD|nr:ROK family protein [Streptomyces sp. NRRL WC-3742]